MLEHLFFENEKNIIKIKTLENKKKNNLKHLLNGYCESDIFENFKDSANIHLVIITSIV